MKFNPYHDDAGRFDFKPDGEGEGDIIPVAHRDKGPGKPKVDGPGPGYGGWGGATRPPGPSQRQVDKFQRQLDLDGRASLEKSELSIQKNLQEHTQKLERLRSEGGYTSSVEREIRTFNEELGVISKLLGR